jgi:hypothetical protein
VLLNQLRTACRDVGAEVARWRHLAGAENSPARGPRRRSDAQSDCYLELYLGIAWAGAVIVPLNIRWAHGRTRTCCAIAGRPCWWSMPPSRYGADLVQKLGGIKLVYADDLPVGTPPEAVCL